MASDVVKGCEIDDDFIRAYDINRELIKNYGSGSLYKVEIESVMLN